MVCEPNESGFFFFGGNKSQHRHHSAASSPRAWLNLHPAPGQRAGKPFLPAPCPSVRLERMWGAFAEVSYSPCEIPNRREPGLAQQRGRKAFGHFSPCLCSQSQSHLPGMRQGLLEAPPGSQGRCPWGGHRVLHGTFSSCRPTRGHSSSVISDSTALLPSLLSEPAPGALRLWLHRKTW